MPITPTDRAAAELAPLVRAFDRTNKNAASVSRGGVCIRTSKEENVLSFAGLAATYSPRA